MATLGSRVQSLVEYIQTGKILEAMTEFYADDAVMQENGNTGTKGLAANIEREKQFLAYVKQWKAFEILSLAVDEKQGLSFMETRLAFEAVDGKNVDQSQVSVAKWKDGKIVHERFYYDASGK